MPRVMLIAREDNMPPIGAIGAVVGEFDGDLEVEFDGYPCDAGPGVDWLCDPRWVVYISDYFDRLYDRREVELAQGGPGAVRRGEL